MAGRIGDDQHPSSVGQLHEVVHVSAGLVGRVGKSGYIEAFNGGVTCRQQASLDVLCDLHRTIHMLFLDVVIDQRGSFNCDTRLGRECLGKCYVVIVKSAGAFVDYLQDSDEGVVVITQRDRKNISRAEAGLAIYARVESIVCIRVGDVHCLARSDGSAANTPVNPSTNFIHTCSNSADKLLRLRVVEED